MKNTIKTIGIIFIIAFAIVACGPGAEPDPTFTVTFTGEGISLDPQTVKKDGKADKPADPTYILSQGLYKHTAVTLPLPSFDKWETADGSTYTFSEPVTADITLTGKWKSAAPTAENLTVTTDDDIVSAAITTVNANTETTNNYTLILSGKVDAKKNPTLTKGNLTIKTDKKGFIRDIKAFHPTTGTLVYLTIGDSTTASNPPTLTLEGIALQGTGVEVGDSLVRITNGGTLIMERDSKVTGHKNSAKTNNGANGNGSAVCVFGGNLTMQAGSFITGNESTENSETGSGTSTNRNRVGGVYTYVPDSGDVKLKITGGEIVDNVCTAGNTKDLYATEGGTFELSGNVQIKEITINADVPGSGTTTVGNSSLKYTVIKVSNLGEEADVKLSLRSTIAKTNVPYIWTGAANTSAYGSGQQVLEAASGTLSAEDVKKFTLLQFKGSDGADPIPTTANGTNPYFIIDTTGKFVKKP